METKIRIIEEELPHFIHDGGARGGNLRNTELRLLLQGY
jgi:hypothetical protein